jgi:hypothetical protein
VDGQRFLAEHAGFNSVHDALAVLFRRIDLVAGAFRNVDVETVVEGTCFLHSASVSSERVNAACRPIMP